MRRFAPDVVLGVILESGGSVKKTRLMKLLFLLSQETSIRKYGAFYDFLPYQFGPYSFFVYRDLQTFEEGGLVSSIDCFRIPSSRQTEAMEIYKDLDSLARQEIKATVHKYRSWSDQKLIDDVYERYPQFALLSKRNGNLPHKPVVAPAVYTMGYQGLSVDAFLHNLIRYGIERLLDVRNNPVSRRYGFSKRTLSHLCQKINVEYVHIPELGIPSEERQTLTDYASYQILLDRYEADMLPKQEEAAKRASSLLGEKASALLCFEADVNCCHRGRLANRLSTSTQLPIEHLTV